MIRGSLKRSSLLVLITLILSLNTTAHALPPNFQDVVIWDNLDTPTAIAFAPNGKIFIAEKQGTIKVFDNLQDTTPTLFADLRSKVHEYSDRGLLGLAVDPQFPARPYVYALYTLDGQVGANPPVYNDNCPNPDICPVGSRLVKLTASGDVMSSEQVLLESWCQIESSHSVGTLFFGNDGALYVSHGDGASYNYVDYGQDGGCNDPANEGGALRSQDLRTSGDPVCFNGTVLRVNPDTGAASAGNPLNGGAVTDDDRIIAYGLRNPFRFSIDPSTNALWVADVGWGDWEEINHIANPTAGVPNFGWPCYEGPNRQNGYDAANIPICENLYSSGNATSPYYAYAHSGSSGAISAVVSYRGTNFPAAYNGALFFADYTKGWIKVMMPGANGLPNSANIVDFVPTGVFVVDLKVAPNGALYYVDIAEGNVRQVSYFTLNTPPTARITADRNSGTLPLTVAFDGSSSTDPDAGDTLQYAWDLDGDGAFDDSTLASPSFTYMQNQTVLVQLRVTDSQNASDTETFTVFAGNRAPVVTIETPLAGTLFKVGDVLNFSGSANDPDSGSIPSASLSWETILHHCAVNDPNECHEHAIQNFSGTSAGSIVASDHEYPARIEFRLTAADQQNANLKTTQTLTLEPQTTTWNFTSDPSGLQLAAYGSAAVTPFSRTVIVNAQSTISAPLLQQFGSFAYQFVTWSDSSSATRNVTATSSPQSFHAIYTPTTAPSVWNSWDVTPQAGSPQASVTSSTGLNAVVEFYESTNDLGINKGSLFNLYEPGVHAEAFNNLENFWSVNFGDEAYPYAGKSTVGRGLDTSEGSALSPLGVRDLQLHPPSNEHNTVAAFKVPQNGNYTVSGLGLRRVDAQGTSAQLRLYNPQGVEMAVLTATNNQDWVTSASSFTFNNLTAGQYIYFGVVRNGDYFWDAVEVSWTVTGNFGNTPPPTPTCTLTSNPASIGAGSSASLNWNSTNASSMSIDQSIGNVTPASGGSIAVSPAVTTTYTASATGAGGTAACTATVTVVPAPTCSLGLNPSSILQGNPSTLSWSTTNATGMSINQNIGSVTPVSGGNRSVSPTTTTTYTGTVTGIGGTATCTATLTVTLPPPSSCTLSVTPSSLTAGNPATLSWTTQNASSISIDQGIGTVTPTSGGRQSVSPTVTTTYTATTTGAGGNSTCTATVTVTLPPPSSCTLSVTPASIAYGGSATLSWSSQNATAISIDQGIGTVTPTSAGSRSVSPTATTTYTATTTGLGGNNTCSTSLTVTPSTQLRWNSWDILTQAGTPQATVTSVNGDVTTNIEFYESTNNTGVNKGSLLPAFTAGAHVETFNNVSAFWSTITGADAYPYAGKSTVNRGSDAGEGNATAPLGVKDLQLHPPSNNHNTVAAFRVPQNGTYVISNIGIRRVSASGNNTRLRIFNAQQALLTTINATSNRQWVTTSTAYTLSNLTTGQYIYFGVDRNGDYGYDAAEISWSITKN